MKRRDLSRKIARLVILGMVPLLSLAACNNFPFFKEKPPVLSKSSQTEQYVLTQALAALALEKGTEDKKTLQSYAKTLNAHGSKKRESQIAVLSIEYTLTDQSEKEVLLIPVILSNTMPSFNALRQVQKNLSTLPYTLHNLRAYYVTVSLPRAQKFSSDASLLRQQLGEERQNMLDDAIPLSSQENVRLQLQLVQFFMAMHIRDAAYLALENAKDSLAELAERNADVDVTALIQNADALESQLRKEMPYKL